MTNEHPHTTPHTEQEIKDYRFILYRIDQLETGEKENFKQIMQMLQVMQEGQTEQSNKIIELSQRQYALEEKTKRIDILKEELATNKTEIINIDRRLGLYQTVLIGVTISVVASIIFTILKII